MKALSDKLRRVSLLLAAALLLSACFAAAAPTAAAEDPGWYGKNEWRGILDVVVGEDFTAALREDGRVLYTGADYNGTGERIAAWSQIQRIELQSWPTYLVGYGVDGSIRLAALFDGELYSIEPWSEEELADWQDVEQLYLHYDSCLGLTEEGKVLALCRKEEREDFCREVSGWTQIRQLGFAMAPIVVGLREDGSLVAAQEDDIFYDYSELVEELRSLKNIQRLEQTDMGVFVIDGDGALVWGASGEGWTNIDSVYAGSDSFFALRRDGTVAVYLNSYPDDLRLREVAGWDHVAELGFDMVGFGRYVPVGLRDDGTVCTVSTGYSGGAYGYWDCSGWTDVQKLYSCSDFTIGLRADGSLLVTGGEFRSADFLDEVAQWSGIRAIFYGGDEYINHIVGLKMDGTLVAAGDNSLGQCEVGP